MARRIDLTARPPAEAVRFFASKGFETGFDWRDVWQQEHARAFTVAKAMRLDILQDIRREVDRALRDGTTAADFKKRLTPLLQEKGWWGRKEMTDPLTGVRRLVQLGSPRRLEVIYDTNLRMAHAAGRWRRIERTKARRPYLRYTAVLDDRTRDAHRAWHDIVLPVDHPFWDTHFPPNGWFCRCIVRQLSDRDLDRLGLEVSPEADVARVQADTRAWRNRRTGAVERVPRGVSPGFAYNVGKAHMRGLAPPPRSGPLPTPAIVRDQATLPMPAARPRPLPYIPPEGGPDDQLDAFLSHFGAARGRPAVFTDRIGEALVISEDLFLDAQGNSKLTKAGRHEFLPMLAAAIRDPDEIWWYWERHKASGDYRLRRRYLLRGLEGARPGGYMAAFDVGEDGWVGVTAHQTARVRTLINSRKGVLAYRRPD